MHSWTANEDGECEHVVYVYRGDQPRIPVFAGKLDNAREDADLIAAAPELLSACKAIRESVDTDLPPAQELERAVKNIQMLDAAIAKAEGKETT